jgi:hypothetical protein
VNISTAKTKQQKESIYIGVKFFTYEKLYTNVYAVAID